MTTHWQRCYARRTGGMTSSAAREILKVTEKPDVISFAGGLPSPDAFPIQAIEAAACRLLESEGTRALQYSTTEGYRPLRQSIVEKMSRYGIVCDEDNVLLTTGSQQALDLIGKILLDPGDVVLCESPSYLGALQAFRAYEVSFEPVPIDDDGMKVDAAEQALKERVPKIIYVLPNFQNPAGTTLSLERREKLVALAEKYGVPIVEDDPYGELRYEGEHLPPLVLLDEQLQMKKGRLSRGFDRGNVIYTSTFSKTLAPGLRLGWVVAPREVIGKLVQAKQGTDLHTSTFDQFLAYEVVRQPEFLAGHVQVIRDMYRERRDTMLQALAGEFSDEDQWTHPQGGLFLWVTLPQGIDTAKLLDRAIEQKVAFVPGQPFFPIREGGHRHNGHGGRWPLGHNTMRLNFSNASCSDIREGIRRLGEVAAQARAERRPTRLAA